MTIVTSDTIKAISAALLMFQGAVEGVKRDSENPFFNSKYADLEKVVDTARPHLQAVGIVFLQAPGLIADGCLSMTTRLIHAESGEWIEGTGSIPLGKKDPQGAGSAQTYIQRYHLMAMLGLPPTDDDGEAAIDRENLRPTLPDSIMLSSIDNAATSESLTTAFGTAWKSTADQTIRATYKTRYEARKKALEPPTPSFDNLPPNDIDATQP